MIRWTATAATGSNSISRTATNGGESPVHHHQLLAADNEMKWMRIKWCTRSTVHVGYIVCVYVFFFCFFFSYALLQPPTSAPLPCAPSTIRIRNDVRLNRRGNNANMVMVLFGNVDAAGDVMSCEPTDFWFSSVVCRFCFARIVFGFAVTATMEMVAYYIPYEYPVDFNTLRNITMQIAANGFGNGQNAFSISTELINILNLMAALTNILILDWRSQPMDN